MTIPSLHWEMTAQMAQKLCKMQFTHYYFKHILLTGLFYAGIVLLAIHTWIPVLGAIGLCAVVAVGYIFFYVRMRPQKNFHAKYQADFLENTFIITGKMYKRTHSYCDVDKIIIKKDIIYLLTACEGVAIPTKCFTTHQEREKFINWMNIKITQNL